MLIQTTAPSRRDPRSPRNPEIGAKAPTELKFSKCARGGCGSQVPNTFARGSRTEAELEALVRRNLETAGWLEGRTPSTSGRLYCSRACRDMAQHSVADAPARPGTPGGCQKSHCVRGGVCLCGAETGTQAGANAITRITVVDRTDGQGKPHRAYQCDSWECHTVSYVEPGTSPEAIAKKAAAEGWRQTPEGTVCSAQCARRLRASVAAGRQDPVVLGDKSLQDAQRPRSQEGDRAAAVRGLPAARLDFPWRATPASGPEGGVYAVMVRRDPHGTWEAACLDIKGIVVRGLPSEDAALAAVRRKALQMISWRQQNDELRTLPGGVKFLTVASVNDETVATGRNPGSVLEPPVVVGVPAPRQTRARRVTAGT
jgi:hypothetical protein